MRLPVSFTIVLVASALAACDRAVQDERAASIARDSALEHDLKLAAADTAPFSEAADVATANAPDPASAPDSIPTSAPPTNRAPADAQNGDVGMRTTRPATGSGATSPDAGGTAAGEGPGAGAGGEAAAARATGDAAPAAGRASASAESYAGPSCASPALADQRRCLLSYLARSDVTLDRNYQALIAKLKRNAGTRAGEREPESVERLRVAQRAWLVYRDNECRVRNRGKEGPLWAPTRAECLAQFSGQRAEELAAALARLNAQ